MKLSRQISRRLHDEHVVLLALLEKFAQALGKLKTDPPAADDPAWNKLLTSLESTLRYEVSRHFEFEEDQIFPRLHKYGQGELAEMLFEEHETIREVATPLIALLSKACAKELDRTGWLALKVSGLELVDRLSGHAEKEQGALVPVIDEMLDEETDNALWADYGNN